MRRPNLPPKQKHFGRSASQKQQILLVLHQLLSNRGLAGTTLDLVAKAANLSRNQLAGHYRNWPTLLSAYIKAGYLLPVAQPGELDQLANLISLSAGQQWFRMTRQVGRYWRSHKASRELLWLADELVVGEQGGVALARQFSFEQFFRQLDQSGPMQGGDTTACMALLLGGLVWLTQQAHLNQPVMGIDLRSESGWLRIEKALDLIYTKLEMPEMKE